MMDSAPVGLPVMRSFRPALPQQGRYLAGGQVFLLWVYYDCPTRLYPARYPAS